MAENSKIEWTDATVNFWWGCTKVGPGCDHCYAEAWSKRTGPNIWGVGVPRRKIKGAVKLIHRLDNEYAAWAADAICAVGNAKAFGLPVPNLGIRRRVFIQSMSDLFDLEVPTEWFAEAWDCIERCNRIDVQVVTKRVSAVEKRLTAIGRTVWPRHVGLMVTVVNQDEADRDIPRLVALKEKFNIPWIGLSIEPMLGAIDLSPWIKFIDWVICGGESGGQARPLPPVWPRFIMNQCAAADVPFLFKQWGAWLVAEPVDHQPPDEGVDYWKFQDGDEFHIVSDGHDIVMCGAQDLREPKKLWRDYWADGSGNIAKRLSKKSAGRLLDGAEHNGFPKSQVSA
ncbi:MAG: phage Gp37/Gp68 family protein [Afipia sp.]|nr:phage Gp37/Gp68 family protein [Afipia sp.]